MKSFLLTIIVSTIMTINIFTLQDLSLDESIESAIENNKELQAERKSQEVSSWRQSHAFTNFLPKAYLNTSAVRIDETTYEKANEMIKIPVISGTTNLPTGDYIPFSAGALQGFHQTSYRTNIVVQQPLFAGGKIFLGYKISRLANSVSDNNYLRKEKETIFQVANLYFNILKLIEFRDLTNNSIDSANAQMERINRMKDLGMARENDILQWRVRIQEHRQSLLEIEDNLAVLLDLWNTIIGRYNKKPASINIEDYIGEIDILAAYQEEDTNKYIEEKVNQVIDNNPLLSTIEFSKEISRISYRMAQGNFLPNLNLQFNYEIDDGDKLDFSGNKSWNIAAVLSMPLFTGGANYTQLNIARNELRKTQLTADSVKEFVINDTKRIVRSQVRSAKNVENYKLSLDLTRSNYDTVSELHKQGMLTNQELLDADSMLRAGELQYISSIYDYIITKFELNKLGARF